MFKNENKTAKQCYQNLANILVGNAKSSMQTMLRKAMGELTLEIMGLTKECFNKDGFVQTPGIKNMMKDIKKVLPKEFSSVDSDRFLKMTRDSIAHNSIEKNNITEEQFNSFNIKLPKNKSGEKALLNVPKLNMIEHMIQYDNARNLGKQFSRLEFEDTYCDTIEDVLKGKKKFGKFSKFISSTEL